MLIRLPLLALVLLPAPQAKAGSPGGRTFSFVYRARVAPVPAGQGPVDLFVPIAQDGPQQEILAHEVHASIAGLEGREKKYGNRFWHGHLDRADGEPITVSVTYTVRRRPLRHEHLGAGGGHRYSEEELGRHRLFLQANQRVPISGEPIDSIVKEIAPRQRSLLRIARAAYDYVIDNMEYKKVGRGWGNGDTFWACSKKYGNCTDFHALFVSLARARGIPARFEIGFPIPTEANAGTIPGYHCWVQFYLPRVGWVPIDASEAKKHPEKRDLLFGTLPADRIRMTVGRDLKLGAGHATSPLSYFVYPHVEVAGKRYDAVETHFSFEERAHAAGGPP